MPLSVENKIVVFFCSEGLYRFKYTFTCSCSTPLDLQVLRGPLKFTTGELISNFPIEKCPCIYSNKPTARYYRVYLLDDIISQSLQLVS